MNPIEKILANFKSHQHLMDLDGQDKKTIEILLMEAYKQGAIDMGEAVRLKYRPNHHILADVTKIYAGYNIAKAELDSAISNFIKELE